MPLLNILSGVVHLPVSVQNIVDCTDHITGVHKKDSKFVVDTFFDKNNDLDPEKKLLELYMFNVPSVCKKAQKILKVVYTMLSCIVEV